MSTRKIGYRISEALLVDLTVRMKAQGRSPRKRSEWIRGALHNLLQKGARELIEKNIFVGDRLNANAIGTAVYVDDDLATAIDNMIYELRRIDPLIEDVQSMLIRAAIRSKLQQGAS